MLKKFNRSFVPYTLLLVGIVALVAYLDYYAAQITTDMNTLVLGVDSEESKIDYLDFQFEVGEHAELKSDSLYLEAVSQYKKSKLKLAQRNFQQLQLTYPSKAIVRNYQGLILMKQGSLVDAQDLFLEALKLDQEYFPAILNLGIVNNKLHRYSKALEYYTKAVEVRPNSAAAHYNLGLTYLDQDSYVQADSIFEKTSTLAAGKLKAKAYAYKALSLWKLEERESAKVYADSAELYNPKMELPRIVKVLCLPTFEEQKMGFESLLKMKNDSYLLAYYYGMALKENKELASAEKMLKKALELNPNDERIIAELSSFLIAAQKVEEAQEVAAAFSAKDSLPQTFFFEAKAANKNGEFKKALKFYNRALKASDYNYPEAYVNKAIIYKKQGDVKKAISNYKKAIESKPNYATAYYNLGLLYSAQSKFTIAAKYYSKAIEQNSKAHKYYYNLGVAQDKKHKYKEALASYQSAINLKSDYLKARVGEASMYSKLKDKEQAISSYVALLELFPNYGKGWYNLGLLQRGKNDYIAAIASYERLLDIDPENNKARMNLGVCYSKTQQYSKAVAVLESALDNDSDNESIRFNLALQYERLKDYKSAIAQYNKTISLNRKHEKALANLHALYHQEGDSINKHIVEYKMALLDPEAKDFFVLGKKLENLGHDSYANKAFRKAKKYGAKGHWVDYWIGKTYGFMGETAKAEKYLSKALAKKSDHKFSLYRLGQINEAEGNIDLAHKYFNKLLKLDPDFKIQKLSEVQS